MTLYSHKGEEIMVPPMPLVLSVEPLENYRLKVSLSTGRTGIFDANELLEKGVFKELKDKDYFNQVDLVFGGSGITWPNEQDISATKLNVSITDVHVKTVKEMLKEESTSFVDMDGRVYWNEVFGHVVKKYACFFAEQNGYGSNL